MNNQQAERELFEAWMKTRPGYPFAGAFANLMWASWQAARATPVQGDEPVGKGKMAADILRNEMRPQDFGIPKEFAQRARDYAAALVAQSGKQGDELPPLPTLPRWLLDIIGEYGMARSDKASPIEIQHRWETLIGGIKQYASLYGAACRASAGASAIVPRGVADLLTKLRDEAVLSEGQIAKALRVDRLTCREILDGTYDACRAGAKQGDEDAAVAVVLARLHALTQTPDTSPIPRAELGVAITALGRIDAARASQPGGGNA